MMRWSVGIVLVLLIACTAIKPIIPTEQELNIREDFNNYSFSDSGSDPIQTIRISIHVIQDSLGQGNFILTDSLGDQSPQSYWLVGLVTDASKRMANLQPMHMPTGSAHIKDSKLRYHVVGIYDWQDQGLYDLSAVSPFTGKRMYRYIKDKEEVTHMDNSLHIFIAGSDNMDNGRIASRGIASGAPDKEWMVLYNYYSLYKSNKDYWPASLVSHELGHNLGLSHTWNRNDGCDDTPKKPAQCWALNEPKTKTCDELSKCSNNLMDYNVWQNALTQCQLAKIHYNINHNKGNLQDIVYQTEEAPTPVCKVSDSQTEILDRGTIALECNYGMSTRWYVSPREAVQNPIGSGSVAKLKIAEGYKGRALITFRVSTKASEYIEITEKIKLRSSSDPEQ